VAKILIVDDDSTVQLTMRLLLERAGHRVVTASDGRKGLAQFQAGDFDLLFVDIFMPGMDGFETMRMVHQQKPLTPIIVISGQPMSSESGPDFLTMATKLGAVSSKSRSGQRICWPQWPNASMLRRSVKQPRTRRFAILLPAHKAT
jgi:CheY-like chemotaxis protein